MRGKLLRVIATGALLVILPPVFCAALEVTEEKDNIVASRLVGRWLPETALNLRLNSGRSAPANLRGEIEFTSDPVVAEKLPRKYEQPLRNKRIYLAGTMKIKNARYPYILIEQAGNAQIMYFRPQGEEPMGEAVALNVMLVAAAKRVDDLLFIGGGSNNRAFSAFGRAERMAKPANGGAGEQDRYYNRKKGFSIRLPRGWEKREGMMGTAVAAISPKEGANDWFRENINVVVEQLAKQQSLEQFFEKSVEAAKKNATDLKVLQKGELVIDAKTKAKWVVISHRQIAVRIKAKVYFFLKDRRGYTITCSAAPEKFDRYVKLFDAIARSFRFE